MVNPVLEQRKLNCLGMGTYFENFDDTFFIICDIDSFKHLTVLSSTQLPYNLVVILLTEITTVKLYTRYTRYHTAILRGKEAF